jgi:hypothetical protein
VARPRNRKAIRQLAEELVNVLDSFGGYGIGLTSPSAAAEPRSPSTAADNSGNRAHTATDVEAAKLEIEPQESDEDYDYDEDYYGDEDPFYVDPWDVKFAVDEVVSSVLKSGLIPEAADLDDAPSLTEIFAVLFGETHELTKKIEYFEDLISGYEDLAPKDDLREAYDVLERVLERLKPRKGTG